MTGRDFNGMDPKDLYRQMPPAMPDRIACLVVKDIEEFRINEVSVYRYNATF